ncbi:RNA polymerase sigma-70 factor [Parabacteroides sp. Marseille-P3160]|uniref:RNA polymerase sigma-70 factor n=1 Tax=Parabacteroides sp. Marseille-P3160 TaxID=1917887 RepID=UPI0009B9BFAE|nr:RNA polymerase sigma-70 factor [Parabacteroides sp. Marseille-P3160]
MDKENEISAFNQLFTTYHGRFVHFANSYVRELAVAEDFVLEAFMYYWENQQTLASESNPSAYILTIIKHKCLNYLQHLQVREDASEKLRVHALWEFNLRISTLEACDPNELFIDEAKEIVDRTLASLPEQTRQAFLLNREHNLSYKEIAQRLGLSISGVEYHISKALTRLRISLKDYFLIILLFV